MTVPARLRIAVLNRNFSPTAGGAERYSMALVEQLSARHDIHVFAQEINHQWPNVTYHNVSSPCTRPRWINQVWYATATWWATRQGFDVVHSHENTWHGQVQTVHVLPVKYTLFNGLTGLRRIAHWVNALTSPRLMAYLLLERARFAGRHKRIVVTSGSLVPQMSSVYPATSHQLQVLAPGVSTAGGIASQRQQLAARRRLSLPELGRGVLFVGNDFRKKGLATLIKALAALPETVWLAVVGGAGDGREFMALAQVEGVRNRVFFLGSLDVMNDAYVASDCLAHPTLEDTFGMVVLEAMAHGLPVVVSSARYCGISGLLNDEVNALILKDPLDATLLAFSLLRLHKDVELSHALKQGSLEFANLHQWADIGLQQEAIYFSVVASTSV